MYRLIGVLLHKQGAHFIADILDPHERCWIRHDGYPPASGLGQLVKPPAGKVKHTYGLRGSYYPIMLFYMRIDAPNEAL